MHQVTAFSCCDASCVHFNKTSAGFRNRKQEEMLFTLPECSRGRIIDNVIVSPYVIVVIVSP